jgi:sterol desaturase/sphingolipid hydroxylase (fatty acid hydroxylase superfamily)
MFVVNFGLTLTAPLLWDAWLGQYRLLDLTGLGIAGAAAVGFVVYQLGMYAWHRTMHSSDTLWRVFHQMHHSTERHDIYSALYFHPFDTLGFAFVGSLALVLVVGIPGESALIVNAVVTACAIVQHANIRTPHWIGWFLQRPEGHMAHHARGVHASNYCDLALIDMAFGTWNNPRTFEGKTGYYDGASRRVGEMLLARDVSRPRVPLAGDPNPAHSGIRPSLVA